MRYKNIRLRCIRFHRRHLHKALLGLLHPQFRLQGQDFGRGIPKDKLDKVFETFFQVDSGMDRKFGGAGLGLAISRGIVVSHGGKIWVESKVEKGSTFSFTLPVKPVKNAEKKFKTLDMFGLGKMEGSGND